MLIALIDGGVDISIFPGIKLKFDLSVARTGEIKSRDPADKILTDHGTNCARIINKYVPEVEFCSIRIFHEQELRASRDQLVAALEWCLNARIPIIHLSIGSNLLSDYKSIRSVVAKLLHQRQVIIAAHSNSSLYSIPACLGGVIGVFADKSLVDDSYKVSNDRVEFPAFFASSRHKLASALSGFETVTQITNSYAAPTITAHVHNILLEYEPFSKSISQLNKLLSGEFPAPQFPKPDYIDNAIIFNPSGYPVLKEHLFFSCVEEYTESREVLSHKKIRSERNDLVYLAAKDSLFDESSVIFLKESKNGFENLLYGGALRPDSGLNKFNGFVWSEKNSEYLNNVYGKEGPILDLPIVNIVGQDMNAIDLLCKLRDLFIENGYQCACLSDHVFSYLYGVEYVSDSIPWPLAIENVLRVYSPDLLINCFQREVDKVELNSDDYIIFIGKEDEYGGSNPFSPKKNQVFHPAQYEEEVQDIFNSVLEFFN